MVECLLPSTLQQMKLGLPKLWQPKFIPSRPAAALKSPPNAIGRMQNAQRIEGFNDEIGDCLPTGVVNGVIDFLVRQGVPMSVVPNSLARDLYIAAAGYVLGDPSTDNGTDPDQFWAWWMQNPILGRKLKGPPALIDPRNDYAVKGALEDEGWLGLVLDLTVEQQNQIIWSATPTAPPWGFHYVNCDGYAGPYTATSWGLEKQIEETFFDSNQVVQVYKFTLIQ